MIRLLIIVLATLAMGCSSHDEELSLGDVDIVGVESLKLEGDEHPQQLNLRVELQNNDKRFSVRSMRLRVGIGARRSVAITLTEPVTVKRGESVVEIPIKFTVTHSSHSAALRKILKERELSLIEFDLSAKVRRGIFTRTMAFSSEELRENYGWQIVERVADFIEEYMIEE